jgi:hypothetical protein
MFLGLRTLRPAAAEKQQRLVAGVGDGVDRLGQHRSRSRDQERGELDDGYAEVGPEGRDHRTHARAVARL